MVLTRSRAASPASGPSNPSVDVRPPPPAPAAALAKRFGDSGTDAATHASFVDTPLMPQHEAGIASTAASPASANAGVASAASIDAAAAAAAAPVVLSTDQLLLLINRLSHCDSVSTPIQTYSGNFAKCTARFDGEKSSNVRAFIDAILTYKDCVGVEEHIALRGLPMLLTGLAATWWQGVKDSTPTWHDAIEALEQTFGPRLPPHKIYRCIFEREQRLEESTDLFVCHIRALFAQLPPLTLTETVQLDMCYGLLHRRVREKVPRSSLTNFGDLLAQARCVEDIFEEKHPRVTTESKPSFSSSASGVKPASSSVPSLSNVNSRIYCNYCRYRGHEKDACPRLANRTKKNSYTKVGADEGESSVPMTTITCFGCGAPGVIRSNCSVCKEKKNVTAGVSVFQSVSASADNIRSAILRALSQFPAMSVPRVSLFLVIALLYMDCCYSASIPRSFDPRLSDEMVLTPKKRPFCNAFTGCGRKRSQNSPGMPSQELMRQKQYVDDETLGSILDTENASIEELSRQILSEAKLWEAIQEASAEIARRKQKEMPY